MLQRYDALRAELRSLRDRGLNGAELQITAKGSPHNVRFYKYIGADGGYGIELVLEENGEPNDPWAKFKEYCINAEVPATHYQMADNSGRYLLRIDCERNVEKARQLLFVIMRDILQYPENTGFEIFAQKISPWMEVIEEPDQEPADPRTGMKLNQQWFRTKFGSPLWMTLLELLMVSGIFIGTVGLLITMIFVPDNFQHIITIRWAGVGVRMPTIGIIFIFLILFGFSAVFLDSYYIISKNNGERHRIPKSFRGVLRAFFGRPANWLAIVVVIVACIRWMQFA